MPVRPRFVNRVVELDRISAVRARTAADGEAALIHLAGARGIGKTTLATHVAYLLADEYPDGGLFLDARGSEPQGSAPAGDLARQLLFQVGVPVQEIPPAAEDRLAVARGKVSGRRLFIVIDDVKNAGQLEGLFGDLSQAAVVVTSRSKLDTLAVHHRFTRIDLAPFDLDATAQLVEVLAGGAVAVPGEVVDALWRKCDGLPIALAAGAGLIAGGDEDPRDFVETLTLADLKLDGSPSVAEVFDAIYGDLDVRGKRDYRLLSLIPGPGFGTAVAAEVLDCPVKEARTRAADLGRRFLLESPGGGRYRFHPLVREHAQDLARTESAKEAQEATERAAFWLAGRAMSLDRAYAARPEPEGVRPFSSSIAVFDGGPEAAAREFEVEWDSLVAAARVCADLGRTDFAVAVPMALYSFGYQTRRIEELVDLYVRALDFTVAPAVRWQLHRDLAGLHEQLGEGAEALAHAQASARAGHAPGVPSSLEWLGLAHERLGRFAEARDYFGQALAALPAMADERHQARAEALVTMHLGRVAFKEGLIGEARAATVRAGQYFAGQERDVPNLGRCEKLLGDVAHRESDVQEARRHWARAADLFERALMPGDAADVVEAWAGIAEPEEAPALRARADRLRARKRPGSA